MWRMISNVLWHVPFLGFLSALAHFLVGLLLCVTVVGLPLGLGLIEYSKFLLAPGTRTLVDRSELPEQQNMLWKGWALVVGLLYLPIGLVLAAANIAGGIGLMLTIIGIPTGLDIVRTTGAVLMPANKVCVPRVVGEAVQANKDRAAVERYLGS